MHGYELLYVIYCNVKMWLGLVFRNLVVLLDLFLADWMAIEFLLVIVFTPSLAHGDVFTSVGEF